MALDRPIHAPGTADGTTARAVAAPGAALHGGLTMTHRASSFTKPVSKWIGDGVGIGASRRQLALAGGVK